MNANVQTGQSMIRQAVAELVSLPDDDLPLVIEFLDYLKQQRQISSPAKSPAAEIRAAARRRATALKHVPRNELVARFETVVESIRAQAIAKGTAIEGDWEGD